MSKSSNSVMKPLFAGAVAFGIQRYYLNKDQNQAMYFGGAVAAGQYVADMFSPSLKPMFGATGGSLIEKVVELGSSGASAIVLNKYVLKNESYRDNMMQDASTIVVANVASELLDDMWNNKKIDYFSD